MYIYTYIYIYIYIYIHIHTQMCRQFLIRNSVIQGKAGWVGGWSLHFHGQKSKPKQIEKPTDPFAVRKGGKGLSGGPTSTSQNRPKE